MSIFVVGVDAGGSRTRVLVRDTAGNELGSAESGGSAARAGEEARTAALIGATVRDALRGASLEESRARVLCAGVAGAGRPAVVEALHAALLQEELADEILVETDASIAMEDAFGEGPGILMIAGTGSIAYGRGPTGEFARCGGWGSICGDEGGGHWLGRRALSVVTAAADGREVETSLLGAVLTATQLSAPEELIDWAARADVAQIAALATAVLHEAESGDVRADSLVSLAAEELLLHVRTLARTLFVDERAAAPVALAGSLLGRRSMLRKKLESRLKSGVPGAMISAEEVLPARGAVRRALRALAAEGAISQ